MNCAQRSHGRARRHPACLGRCMSRTTPRSKRMRIGIIGAGHIGGTLARELTELGDQVRVANSRGPASLASLAHETGARAVAVEDAVRDVQLVIVTIPQKSVPELSKGLFDGVDAGSLDESWRQQPGTPVYCTDLSREGVRRALAKADRAKAPEIRELFMTRWQQLPERTTPRELGQLARELAGATAL